MAAVFNGILLKSSRNHGVIVSKPFIVTARFSTDNSKRTTAESSRNPLFDPSLSALKRGTGGRSSFNGMITTVFGATGLVGQVVCNRLGKIGSQVIIPYRGDNYDVLPLKLVGDLGQVLFFPYQLKDEESVRKAMAHSNVVINLIGRDWETKNFKFRDVNVIGARKIAQLARESGVKRLIHFSAMNATPNPKGIILPEGSKFLATKYEGELAVKEEFPTATIFRPADIYGQGDRFLRYYAHGWRRAIHTISLWNKGEKTIKAPIYNGDVAGAVVNALKDPESQGKTYELYGPKHYQLSELVDYIFRVLRRDTDLYKRRDLRWDLPFRARVTFTEKICPGWPIGYLGWDKMERDHTSDIPTGCPTLEDLGVIPTELESRIQWELKPFRAHNYYAEELGEFPDPAPPKTVTLED
jgi:NADH dehydrogenase (ubiquinone) 1 alpha subcomplex subunit 9